MEKILTSAIMGMFALLLINLTSFITGVSLSINFLTIGISSLLGISGVISMVILGYIIK